MIAITSSNLAELPSFDLTLYNSLDAYHKESGQQLYTKINNVLSISNDNNSSANFKAARITGMILELRSSQIQQLLNSDAMLKAKIDEGLALLATPHSPVASSHQPSTEQQQMSTTATYTSSINNVQLNNAKIATRDG